MSHSVARRPESLAVGRAVPARAPGAEKLGVMGGFVAGLALALGTVHDAVLAQGLPDLVADGAAVLTVALVTGLGLRFGTAIAKVLARR